MFAELFERGCRSGQMLAITDSRLWVFILYLYTAGAVQYSGKVSVLLASNRTEAAEFGGGNQWGLSLVSGSLSHPKRHHFTPIRGNGSVVLQRVLYHSVLDLHMVEKLASRIQLCDLAMTADMYATGSGVSDVRDRVWWVSLHRPSLEIAHVLARTTKSHVYSKPCCCFVYPSPATSAFWALPRGTPLLHAHLLLGQNLSLIWIDLKDQSFRAKRPHWWLLWYLERHPCIWCDLHQRLISSSSYPFHCDCCQPYSPQK